MDVDLASVPFTSLLGGAVDVFPIVWRVAGLGFRLLGMVEGRLPAVLREDVQGFEETRVITDRDLAGGDRESLHIQAHIVRCAVLPGLDVDPAGFRCARGDAFLFLREKQEHARNDGDEQDGDHPDETAFFLGPYRGGRRCHDLGGGRELLLDLLAVIADLRPFQRPRNVLAPHPCEKRQAARRSGMVLVKEGFQHRTEVRHIAEGMFGGAVAGDDQVFQPDDPVLVDVDRVQPKG